MYLKQDTKTFILKAWAERNQELDAGDSKDTIAEVIGVTRKAVDSVLRPILYPPKGAEIPKLTKNERKQVRKVRAKARPAPAAPLVASPTPQFLTMDEMILALAVEAQLIAVDATGRIHTLTRGERLRNLLSRGLELPA